MKRLACLPLLLLAACPPPGSSARPAQPTGAAGAAGAGCPAANDVHVASYLTQDEHGVGDASAGHTGWVLPLHAVRVPTVENQPEYRTIDATTAGAVGVPPAPTSIWLVGPGQAPCKATVGSYYAAAVESSIPNVTYGVELSGCAAPPRDQQQVAEAIALVSEAPPTGCQIVAPQPIAARLGETDSQKRWQRPTKQTPIPPALAAVLPAHDCQAPGCEMLWAIAQVTVANRPVAWSGAVNWLTIPPNASPASQCEWKADTFAGFFVAGSDGRPVKVTEGQDHPLLLGAVLADQSGARALVAEGSGEYTIYDLTGGGARVARHVVWLLLPPEAYGIDERIGPVCGDDAAPH
ncbi:MAG TPA: hypothetical protein VFT22_11200 [Kofleriaceae bacterium]|nr:hypothetical protein [Kofleriaceae bacterium]